MLSFLGSLSRLDCVIVLWQLCRLISEGKRTYCEITETQTLSRYNSRPSFVGLCERTTVAASDEGFADDLEIVKGSTQGSYLLPNSTLNQTGPVHALISESV